MAKKLIHSSPLGLLFIPEVGEVPAGVPFDAPDDIAPGLLVQTDLYQPAPAPGKGKRA